ncbi:hypothetical protein COLU111180_07785 [Cohnella lubricantis]|uniref:Uncharacterized protein n=1 Tax=Cohnella lubricantis TaxID=2163172 RepID=A0A841T8W8_9BACL|nr:hypothetical protein [Cohnella lubricantis]MBB6677744.1 hypothetical protein [Cohnella lubricantis]MBP2117706.1 hypothetical protein [Cohnella lubricantis]
MFDRRWLLLLTVGFAAVVLLGQLARWDHLAEERKQIAASVFKPQRVEKLADDRIVDAFIALPLEPRLSSVGWDHAILSVDLSVGSGDTERQLWSDVADLVRLSFGQLSNVRQLLIRVFAENGDGKKTLLFSAVTRASDWQSLTLSDVQAPEDGSAPKWTARLDSAWTASGERWRRNFANS